MAGEIGIIILFCFFGLSFLLRIFFRRVFYVYGPRGREDRYYQRVEDELNKAASTQQSELRLMNIVEVIHNRRAWDSYVIKDAGRKTVGRAYGQYLCANCGNATIDAKHCPSCGASARFSLKLLVKYVFEGIDGTRQGEIHCGRDILEVYDAQNQLRAIIKPTNQSMRSFDLRGYAFGVHDPQGRILAEYHGDREGYRYQILTPTRSVIADVLKEMDSDEYYIYNSPDGFEPFLVLNYVVAMDFMIRELRNRRSD